MTAFLGRNISFKIGSAANSLTTISGSNGLGSVEISDTVPTRVIPTQTTSVERQSTGIHSRTISFDVDANTTTWPLLINKTGELIYFEFGPRGSASGMPKWTGAFFATVSMPVPYDDVLRFTVEGELNGALTEGTF